MDNDAAPVHLKRASRKLKTLLGLDYSIASVTRIQQWLDRQRSLRSQAGREIYVHALDGDTLMLLSFYLAEWIGRSVGSPPVWSMRTLKPGSQVCIVNFPEYSATSLGVVKLPGIVAHAWTTEGANLAASLEQLIDLRVLGSPTQSLKPLRADRDTVFHERADALEPVVRSAMWSARPPTLEHGDPLSGYFAEQRELFERGHFTCGGVIQAHADLHKPEYVGLRIAEVVYDPANLLRYDDVQALAKALRCWSETVDEVDLSPPTQALRTHLRSCTSRMLSEDVSSRLFGYPLKICSIWVDQEHLPDGMLSYQGVPLVIAPDVSRHAKLLPHQAWSEEFREAWLSEGQARWGKRHAIAKMMVEAREQSRQIAERMFMVEMGHLSVAHEDAAASLRHRARLPWRFVAIFIGVMSLALLARWLISSS
ncbi:hypothetical protein G7047_04035 [Diaphorobacter sp. HDW4A]|uniref:hypothetical protein n=1 Tax=Diaphorobacter sp. HDW4A TaxID=2714924 RepID=UPI001409BC9F|nr:hypothetical protein [Diaphorobacter sp. HDW4A]QIL79174.1 hypothetical protein G7047_04035 [Diaphorobacter sp. HDW4A]